MKVLIIVSVIIIVCVVLFIRWANNIPDGPGYFNDENDNY
jgi:hypothetical protein